MDKKEEIEWENWYKALGNNPEYVDNLVKKLEQESMKDNLPYCRFGKINGS
ncbi:hypothetical protein HYU07_06885 [Candidatus Woesearchaeota archaeon]|nr:hypothetical protein [Candidatus Woesearchaeota archaeon]